MQRKQDEKNLNFEEMATAIQTFKKTHHIKSLRRQVFGVSENKEEMDKIDQYKRQFLAIPGMIDFITHNSLVSQEGKLEFPADSKQDTLLTKKGKKYLAIVLGRITRAQLKNPSKYSDAILYDSKGRSQKQSEKGLEQKLAPLRKSHHSIPAFAQFDDKGGPLDFSYKNSIKNYFSQIYKQTFEASEKKITIPQNCEVSKEILYGEELNRVITENSYPGKKYVILFYAHKALRAEGYHTSVLLCGIKNNKIDGDKVINIDGWNWPTYTDILGETPAGKNQGQKSIKQRVIIAGENGNLQLLSYNNMNCPVYAANFAKAIVTILNHKEEIVENALAKCNTNVRPLSAQIVTVGNQSPANDVKAVQPLIDAIGKEMQGVYLTPNKKRDDVALSAYHRNMRIQVARSFLSTEAAKINSTIESKTKGSPPQQVKQNLFQRFDDKTPKERKEILDIYHAKQKKNQDRDFDNNSITTSAIQVLKSWGIDEKKCTGIQVGPNYAEDEDSWNLSEQLSTRLRPEDYKKDYIFFSIPTNNGQHSIPAVICTRAKTIYCIDSLNNKTFLSQAKIQLDSLLKQENFKGYKISQPPDGSQAQQNDFWSCGIHSSANIIGIILNEEIKEKRIDRNEKSLQNRIIDLSTGEGIKLRTETEMLYYETVLRQAVAEHNAETEEVLKSERVPYWQYYDLNSFVSKLSEKDYSKLTDKDIKQFKTSVENAYKKAQEKYELFSEGRGRIPQTPLKEFFITFISIHPSTSLKTLLEDKRFLEAFPQTLQDGKGNSREKLKTAVNKHFEEKQNKVSPAKLDMVRPLEKSPSHEIQKNPLAHKTSPIDENIEKWLALALKNIPHDWTAVNVNLGNAVNEVEKKESTHRSKYISEVNTAFQQPAMPEKMQAFVTFLEKHLTDDVSKGTLRQIKDRLAEVQRIDVDFTEYFKNDSERAAFSEASRKYRAVNVNGQIKHMLTREFFRKLQQQKDWEKEIKTILVEGKAENPFEGEDTERQIQRMILLEKPLSTLEPNNNPLLQEIVDDEKYKGDPLFTLCNALLSEVNKQNSEKTSREIQGLLVKSAELEKCDSLARLIGATDLKRDAICLGYINSRNNYLDEKLKSQLKSEIQKRTPMEDKKVDVKKTELQIKLEKAKQCINESKIDENGLLTLGEAVRIVYRNMAKQECEAYGKEASEAASKQITAEAKASAYLTLLAKHVKDNDKSLVAEMQKQLDPEKMSPAAQHPNSKQVQVPSPVATPTPSPAPNKAAVSDVKAQVKQPQLPTYQEYLDTPEKKSAFSDKSKAERATGEKAPTAQEYFARLQNNFPNNWENKVKDILARKEELQLLWDCYPDHATVLKELSESPLNDPLNKFCKAILQETERLEKENTKDKRDKAAKTLEETYAVLAKFAGDQKCTTPKDLSNASANIRNEICSKCIEAAKTSGNNLHTALASCAGTVGWFWNLFAAKSATYTKLEPIFDTLLDTIKNSKKNKNALG